MTTYAETPSNGPICDVYDTALSYEDKFEFIKGEETNSRRNSSRIFPMKKKKIENYCELLFSLQKKKCAVPRLENPLPGFIRPLLASFFRNPYLKYAGRTTNEGAGRIGGKSQTQGRALHPLRRLRMTPDKSSFAMHALLDRHYVYGGYYPVGGSVVFLKK